MSNNRKSLKSWIEECLSDTEKGGPCSCLSLIYKKPEGGSKEIHSLKLGGKTHDPEQLSNMFKGKAETYAQDLEGIQRFSLIAFYKSTHEPEAELPFIIVDGELSSRTGRSVKEDPTATGLMAQFMRHLERKDESLIDVVKGFAAVTLNNHQLMVTENQRLREEVNDAYSIVREMVLERRKEDHDMRMKEMQFARESEDRKQLFKTLPALANTVAGREVFPQSVADTALIEGLGEHIAPDDIKKLVDLGVIKAEVAGPLIARLAEIQERKNKEAEAVKQLPPAKNTNGGLS